MRYPFRKMVSRVASHYRRARRSHRLGVSFIRRSSFKIPTSLSVNGRRIPISVPADDHGANGDFIVCFLDDEYGLENVGTAPRTVLDIGANLGFFSLAARRMFPHACIHAYEPNPRVLQYCSHNLRECAITLHGEALGASHDLVSISDCPNTNQARTIQGAEAGTLVPQVSLQTAVQRIGGHVDLAKIDCEGAEWELFKDGDAWKHIACVRMEYHCWHDHTYADVEHAFAGLGFSIQKHDPSGGWGTVWATNDRS